MKIFEIVAILGALAWLPHLIKFIKDLLTTPEIRVITQRNAEIGYTAYGPIFNLRIAFATKHRDIVISSIKIRLIHESGEEKLFSWHGIMQSLGEMRNIAGTSIPWEKEQSVLAIKLNVKEIEERLIRFQEEDYHNNKEIFEAKSAKKFAYLREKGDIDYDEYLKSEEMKDLFSYIKQRFNWKAGKYTIIFEIESSDNFKLTDNKYSFSLTALDIELLEKNKELIELSYENILKSVIQEYKMHTIIWNWRNPILKKET